MADDNAPNKPVHLIYLSGGLVVFYLLQWSIEWIWGYFTRYPSEFKVTLFAAIGAILATIFAYRNRKTFGLVSEVAAELQKVSWPTGQETKVATIIVIVMTIISALVLGLFDFVFGQASQLIYGA